jgi:hypothetical protein
MISLVDLWLPIVLASVFVWIASALAWMVMPHHKGEFKGLPDENGMIEAVRRQNLAPGVYGFPDCQDHSKMKDPEFLRKMNEGPVGVLHVWPPGMKMGGKMLASFIFYIVTSVFVAYLAVHALKSGADFISVFRITGTAAILAYCFASIPNAIWFNTPTRSIVTNFIDGVVYGLITGAIFAWLWPSA